MSAAVIERTAAGDFDVAAHVDRMNRDGFTIIENFLGADRLQAVRDGLAPHFGTHRGRNPFEGLTTERVYTLVARGKVFEDVTEDPRLLALLDAFLAPGYLLSASHAICIYPGEAQQDMHFDDSFYPMPRPRGAMGVTMICAIDDFTAENGGTAIHPGSHLWGDVKAELANAGPPISLEMPAGACAVWPGTLVHGAGANRSDKPRRAFTNQYCPPWGRQQENFFLGVPPEMARAMSPRVQALLGYQMNGSIMGQVTGRHPLKALAEGFEPSVAKEPRAV
ncbi:MAG TPA: phytanoyl-CoA dioxygenase family protein [Phenylobacterium sp.]|nr:phytanoyl-CoA dioxygenase family protein [Phenylobacterium sp.]